MNLPSMNHETFHFFKKWVKEDKKVLLVVTFFILINVFSFAQNIYLKQHLLNNAQDLQQKMLQKVALLVEKKLLFGLETVQGFQFNSDFQEYITSSQTHNYKMNLETNNLKASIAMLTNQKSAAIQNIFLISFSKKSVLSAKGLDLEEYHNPLNIPIDFNKKYRYDLCGTVLSPSLNSQQGNTGYIIQTVKSQQQLDAGIVALQFNSSELTAMIEEQLDENEKYLIYNDDASFIMTNIDGAVPFELPNLDELKREHSLVQKISKVDGLNSKITFNSLIAKDMLYKQVNIVSGTFFAISLIGLLLYAAFLLFLYLSYYVPINRIVRVMNPLFPEKPILALETDKTNEFVKFGSSMGKAPPIRRVITNVLLTGLVTENCTGHDIYRLMEKYKMVFLPCYFTICVIQGDEKDDIEDLIQFSLESNIGKSSAIKSEDGQYIMIHHYYDKIEHHEIIEFYSEYSNTFKTKLSMCIGVSNCSNDPFELSALYKNATAAIKLQTATKKNISVFIYSAALEKLSCLKYVDVNFENKLSNILHSGNIDSLQKYICEIIDKSVRSDLPFSTNYELCVFLYTSILRKSAENENLLESLPVENYKILMKLSECVNTNELKDTMMKFMSLIISFENTSVQTGKVNINEILLYIQEHLRDVQLEEIAVQFNVSAGYLSKLIKQATNMSYIKYLSKQRIDAAKKMLELTNKKLKDISQEVGYMNYNIFIRSFKNQEGLLPVEYRAQHRQNDIWD